MGGTTSPTSHTGFSLCPVTAIRRVFSFVQNPPLQSQAFMWVDPTSLAYKVFTYSRFLRCLQNILQALGLPAKDLPVTLFAWVVPPLPLVHWVACRAH